MSKSQKMNLYAPWSFLVNLSTNCPSTVQRGNSSDNCEAPDRRKENRSQFWLEQLKMELNFLGGAFLFGKIRLRLPKLGVHN